jgi:two-component system, LytTR family, response regulator
MQTLIIDDEKHCRDSLAILLAKYCPEVEVLAQCSGGEEGLRAIEGSEPDLIFLDISMPGMTGFQMLEQCKDRSFEVIFTTAYDEYAIQAIRHSALDYLLKPIDKNELLQAMARAKGSRANPPPARIGRLLELLDTRTASERVALPTVDGLIIIDTRNILYCESENNYTRFFMVDGKNIFVSKTLKKVEAIFKDDHNFFRNHNSFLINLKYIHRYLKGDGGEVILSNGKSLPIARTKKQEFLDRLEKL